MSWAYLFGAILFELAGTTSMKLSEGFTKLVPSILIFVCYICSFTLVTLAIQKIEIGIAYAIWAGVGTLLVALIGIMYFGESVSIMKLISIAFIILGVIGLKLSAN